MFRNAFPRDLAAIARIEKSIDNLRVECTHGRIASVIPQTIRKLPDMRSIKHCERGRFSRDTFSTVFRMFIWGTSFFEVTLINH
jgi:hypothetical protein